MSTALKMETIETNKLSQEQMHENKPHERVEFFYLYNWYQICS